MTDGYAEGAAEEQNGASVPQEPAAEEKPEPEAAPEITEPSEEPSMTVQNQLKYSENRLTSTLKQRCLPVYPDMRTKPVC